MFISFVNKKAGSKLEVSNVIFIKVEHHNPIIHASKLASVLIIANSRHRYSVLIIYWEVTPYNMVNQLSRTGGINFVWDDITTTVVV